MPLTAAQVKTAGIDESFPFGPLHAEIWRVTGTQVGVNVPAVGDTVAIAPRRGRFVVSAIGGLGVTNIPATPGASVTFTLKAVIAVGDTFDLIILVQE